MRPRRKGWRKLQILQTRIRRPADEKPQAGAGCERVRPYKNAYENPQAGAGCERVRPYKNASREAFLSEFDPKPYKAEDSGFTFNVVRSDDFLV
jgi:hypothetical protein